MPHTGSVLYEHAQRLEISEAAFKFAAVAESTVVECHGLLRLPVEVLVFSPSCLVHPVCSTSVEFLAVILLGAVVVVVQLYAEGREWALGLGNGIEVLVHAVPWFPENEFMRVEGFHDLGRLDDGFDVHVLGVFEREAVHIAGKLGEGWPFEMPG